MYAIYGNIYHQYTLNVSIYTIHGSYGYVPRVSLLGGALLASISPNYRKKTVFRAHR